MEKWSKREEESGGGGADVKVPNLPQKHSASVQLVTAQSVKAVGFQYKLLLILFSFYHPC